MDHKIETTVFIYVEELSTTSLAEFSSSRVRYCEADMILICLASKTYDSTTYNGLLIY